MCTNSLNRNAMSTLPSLPPRRHEHLLSALLEVGHQGEVVGQEFPRKPGKSGKRKR
jgi:hypothetical protein